MEAPKFRAWISEADTLTNDLKGIDFENNTVVLKKFYWEDGFPVEEEVFEVEIGNAIPMQSTGLVDKSGKKIFEGDIVKMSKDVYSEPTYYEVVRHYGGAYRLESKQHGCELWLRHTDCEVVGNIYENRELLEAIKWTQK